MDLPQVGKVDWGAAAAAGGGGIGLLALASILHAAALRHRLPWPAFSPSWTTHILKVRNSPGPPLSIFLFPS
jgi:hypothetical protein